MNSIYILIAIILWGSLGIFVRLAGVPVQTIMFYSVLAALIIQSLLLTRKSYRQYFPRAKDFKYPILLGVVSLLNTFTFFFAYQNTTIANAILTHYTAPVFVAFLAALLLKEKLTIKIIAVIAIASFGLWIMLNGFSIEKGHGLGIISGLVSGLMYAMIIIILRAQSVKFHPLSLAFISNFVIVLLLAPFIREFPVNALWIFITMGIVHSTIAPILYFKGLQTVSANKAAVLGYMEPVVAIILSAIFLHEKPGANTILGGLLIILSGWITLIKKQNKNSVI